MKLGRQRFLMGVLAAFLLIGCDRGVDPLPAPSLLLIGDSRVDEWPVEGFTGWHVARRGLPGETSIGASSRLGDLMRELKPQKVVIFTGVNDLIPVGGYPEQKDELVDGAVDAIAGMATKAESQGADVLVICVLPGSHRAENRASVWNQQVEQAVRELNAKLGPKLGSKFLDVQPELVDVDGYLKFDLTRDHLHLNSAGYAKLTAAVMKKLGPPSPK